MNILDFETNFETAAKFFLGTQLNSYTNLQIASSLDQANFTIPRVEINAELQGAEDPATQDELGRFNYSQYSINFVIKVISDLSDNSTDASTGQTPAETHRAIRKLIRESMLLTGNNFTTPDNRQVQVDGAGTPIANGVYTLQSNGSYKKPAGVISGAITLNTTSSEWEIYQQSLSTTDILYTTTNAPSEPTDSLAIWAAVAPQGSDPAPSVSVGPVLADYEVKYLRPAGTDYEVDEDLGISTLNYEIKFCTRPSRWGL